MKKGIYFIFAIILSLTFVFAAHVITTSTGGTSYNYDEDISSIYNITVNNTDSLGTGNISEVNITIPSSFALAFGSANSSNLVHAFSNTSTVLSWTHFSLVSNLTTEYFWFNATATTPGDYNLTITTVNSTYMTTTNISVAINDTTDPDTITFVTPTESDNSNISQTNIEVNVTATDNGVIDTIIARLYNSTNDEINSSNSSTSPLYINFTGLSDGTYYFNATVNDTYGNVNNTATRTINIDTTNPVISLINPSNSTSSTTSAYNFTFNVTDTSTITSCDLILDASIINTITTVNNTGGTNGMYNSSLSVATHTWSVNCTDASSNIVNSTSRTLTVSSSSSSSTTTTTTSSSPGISPKLRPTITQLVEGYEVTLPKNWKIEFDISEESHLLTINAVGTDSVDITIESDPQEETLSVGEEKKFELTGDTIYDLSVTLEEIVGVKANLVIKSISEEIPEEVLEQQAEEAAATDQEREKKSLTWLWIIIGVIVVLIAAGTGYKIKTRE